MLSILSIDPYRRLFAAQVLSLLGTGLTTVALGLLAFELAGADAGVVLGIALMLKMIVYVGFSPVAELLARRIARKRFLVGLDLLRAGFVLLLPFASEVWHIYVLIVLFQACSAAFTPVFQATIPDILPDEDDYTKALSLSRLAYDLEALLSPLLAGMLLGIMSFHWLFAGTTLGFVASGALVLGAALPRCTVPPVRGRFRERLTRGAWIYLQTPRLRGLLALSCCVAAAGAMVIVNTVVMVRADFGGSERQVAMLFAAFGAGSMVVALGMPRLLQHVPERRAMLGGGAALAVGLCTVPLVGAPGWAMVLWSGLGAASALVQTPAGLLLRRSAHPEDRPAVFAAQFALSHLCWLFTYPLAGWGGALLGLPGIALVLAGVALAGVGVAAHLWPPEHSEIIEHEHPAPGPGAAGADLPPGHVAPEGAQVTGRRHGTIRHAHAFIVDDHHPVWPRS